jgi:type VI secretion system protein ImpG
MSQNKYYQEELRFLRELGKEFADANPSVARFLAARGSDPDVERLLDGFAFLTGHIRAKIDDEFPEVIQGLMQLLWPHYLRPIPALSILQFEPIAGMVNDIQKIPRATEVDSVAIEGTRCRFRTCYDIDLLPLTVTNAVVETPVGRRSQLRLRFKPIGGIQLKQLSFNSITVYLAGEPAYALYLWLCRRVGKFYLNYKVKQEPGEDRPDAHFSLDTSLIEPLGFGRDESLIPYPLQSFEGYRLLQEYFALPEKFLFLKIKGLDRLNSEEAENDFELIFEFTRPFPGSQRVTNEHIRLNCTPIVNIFPMDADPIRVDHSRTEYRLRPAGKNPLHYQIFSIDQVTSKTRGKVKEQTYESFYSFRHDVLSQKEQIYYAPHIREKVKEEEQSKVKPKDRAIDVYLSFVNTDWSEIIPQVETVAVKLTCINRLIPEQLGVGDIHEYTDTSPEFARFTNITDVRREILQPFFGKSLYWKLLSHISLNYLSLANVEPLRVILSLYNFQALYDQQAARENELRLEGITKFDSRMVNRIFKGAPVSGISLELFLKEGNFAEEGSMFLFAGILSEFFTLYASINSFTELTVRGADKGEVYTWLPKIGKIRML